MSLPSKIASLVAAFGAVRDELLSELVDELRRRDIQHAEQRKEIQSLMADLDRALPDCKQCGKSIPTRHALDMLAGYGIDVRAVAETLDPTLVWAWNTQHCSASCAEKSGREMVEAKRAGFQVAQGGAQP